MNTWVRELVSRLCGDSALLVNGRDQPSIGHEVVRDLASADQVDLLCGFIKWHGVRLSTRRLASCWTEADGFGWLFELRWPK